MQTETFYKNVQLQKYVNARLPSAPIFTKFIDVHIFVALFFLLTYENFIDQKVVLTFIIGRNWFRERVVRGPTTY